MECTTCCCAGGCTAATQVRVQVQPPTHTQKQYLRRKRKDVSELLTFFRGNNSVAIPPTKLAMDSMKGQGGIQMLLTAEQEAQQIVAAARNLKLTRLKQAKEEAEKDIADYRSQLDAEYKNKISETTGSSGSTAKLLEEETEMKIRNLNDTASKVSPDVVGMLIKNVTAVKT